VGAGVETRLWGGWTAKLEYLYVDLGTFTTATPLAVNPVFGPAFTTGFLGTVATSMHFRDNVVRVGLNYKFDWDYYPEPVIYK
jgi:outer membrane immunogenic protein